MNHKILTRISTGTIQQEIKDEFFAALQKRAASEAIDFLERRKIEEILKEDKPPISLGIIKRIAHYFKMDMYIRNKVTNRLYFSRAQAQLIKKTIREVYLLGI